MRVLWQNLGVSTIRSVWGLGLLACLTFVPVRANAAETVASKFFAKHCTSCHGAKKPKARLSLHDFSEDVDFKKEGRKWQKSWR